MIVNLNYQNHQTVGWPTKQEIVRFSKPKKPGSKNHTEPFREYFLSNQILFDASN